MRVIICVPSFDDWKADFALSLCGLLRYLDANPLSDGSRIESFVLNLRGSVISRSRELLAEKALTLEADWLLWLDSDMVFPPDTLHRLLASGQGVIAANYPRREAPGAGGPAGVAVLHKENALLGWDGAGLREVSACGLGVFLVRCDLIRPLRRPLFGHSDRQIFGGEVVGEDVYFCAQLTKAGHRIVIDLELSRQIGHIITAPLFSYGLPELMERPFYII